MNDASDRLAPGPCPGPTAVPSKVAARRRGGRLAALLFLALLIAAAALAYGAEPVSLLDALRDPASLDRVILLKVRLPRVLLAALAGAGLSAVGAGFQSLLRNPLAEPYVLGVSGGAAVGATAAIVAGAGAAGALGLMTIPAAALAGGLAATTLVYAVARSAGAQSSSVSLVLAGVIVNAVAAAIITLVKTLVSAERAQQLLFWLVGFVDVPSPAMLVVVAVYVACGLAALLADSGRLNLLALGLEEASHLGVDVRALERRVFFAASCVVGAIVSATGLIGFVGLVVPHAARRLLGSDLRVLLPASIFGGAATLVLCDLGARAAFRWLGTEPPVGAVTALFGGPAFLLLLQRSRRTET